jgi:hypothetical protein
VATELGFKASIIQDLEKTNVNACS